MPASAYRTNGSGSRCEDPPCWSLNGTLLTSCSPTQPNSPVSDDPGASTTSLILLFWPDSACLRPRRRTSANQRSHEMAFKRSSVDFADACHPRHTPTLERSRSAPPLQVPCFRSDRDVGAGLSCQPTPCLLTLCGRSTGREALLQGDKM